MTLWAYFKSRLRETATSNRGTQWRDLYETPYQRFLKNSSSKQDCVTFGIDVCKVVFMVF